MFAVKAKSNIEDVRLVTLDLVTDNGPKYNRKESRILEINPVAVCCSDHTQCITFINSARNEKTILIIWSGYSDDLLSKVHNYPLLLAVFLYSEKRSYVHDRICSKYSKIIGVFTDQDALINQVSEVMKVMGRMVVAFSLFDQQQRSVRNLSKTSASFIWYQLLIDVLKNMPQDEESKNHMLAVCEDFYACKKEELIKIAQFRQSYTKEKAISWYTDECFLYKLLNRGLRTEDIDLLYSFRFFIIDLSDALENECQKLKTAGWLTLYRGQSVSDRELEELRANVGALISFNGFLSTSRNKDVALGFARKSATTQRSFQICLIEIRADPSLKSVVAADIEQFSEMKGEQEVLLGLGTTFKIESVGMDETLNLWKIHLVTTDEGVERTEQYLRAQKEMMKEYSPLISFGRLLWNELGQIDRAEKYFKNLLKSVPQDHPDISDIYNGMGCVYAKKGKLDLALNYYKEAYQIRKQTLQETDPKMAGSLHNIAVIYKTLGNTDRALDSYYQALNIHDKNYPGDHEDKGYTIESIGLTYKSKEEFDTALLWLNRALDMHKRLFPAEHPEIAKCLGSIGSVYEEKGELDKALDYYQRQLDMEEKCLPADHSRLVKHLEWIARIHIKQNNPAKALALYREKLAAQRSILDENHPNIALRLMKIGDLLKRQAEYYEQALKVFEKSKASDPILKIKCLDTLSIVAMDHGNFQLALTRQLDILDLCREIYEPDHPDIAFRLQKIGDIYTEKMCSSEQASQYYQECLAIYETIYNPRRKEVVDIKNKICKIQGRVTCDDVQTKLDNVDDDNFSLFD